jgi:hypothetical protein
VGGGGGSVKGLKHLKADTIKYKKSGRNCRYGVRVMRRHQIKSQERILIVQMEKHEISPGRESALRFCCLFILQ